MSTTTNCQVNPAAYSLAKAAKDARLAKWNGEQEMKTASWTTALAIVCKLLSPYWEALGIEPDSFTTTSDDQYHWEGSTTFGDDPVYTLGTSVHVYTNILQIAVYDEKLQLRGAFYTPNGKDQGLSDTLNDERIGALLLNAWISKYNDAKKDRESSFRTLLKAIEQNRPNWNGTEEKQQEFKRQVYDLKPGDLPEPFELSLLALHTALQTTDEQFASYREAQERQRQERQATVEAAKKIKSCAMHWLRDQGAWKVACRALADTVTRHHWRGFTVYSVKYTAIGASAIRNSGEYEEDETTGAPVESVYTLSDSMNIARSSPGVRIQAVNPNGNMYDMVIGAFLDGTLVTDEKQPPAADTKPNFYVTKKAAPPDHDSGYYMNFPPLMSSAEIQAALDLISYPKPPKEFAQTVLDQLGIYIRDYNLRYASQWQDLEPEEISDRALELNPEPGTVIDERDRIPF